MKSISSKWVISSFLILFAFSACLSSTVDLTTPSAGSPSSATSVPVVTGSNVLNVTVNGANCGSLSSWSYNLPCVVVTVCQPGTDTCTTVDDILLDTGSYGFRVFSSALGNLNLTQVASGSGSLAQCEPFGSGSITWGPVKIASLILGGESAVKIPIQVIDSSFSNSSACLSTVSGGTIVTSPEDEGFNGILGVGNLVSECDSNSPAPCATNADNGIYFSCTGSTCTGTTAALSTASSLGAQVQNPVSLLPADNNGVIVDLPNVGVSGAISASGYLILGIDTENNNGSSGATKYSGDSVDGYIQSIFSGNEYVSILDTGSNGIYFDTSVSNLFPDCSDQSGWVCPSSTQTLSAVNEGASGSPAETVSFSVANEEALDDTGNLVSNDLGADGGTQFLDFGVPFFLGRPVCVGLEGKSSNLGTGPYFAY